MLKKDLDRNKWLKGTLKVDRDNLKVYIRDIENDNRILITDGTKVLPYGMLEAEYRNIVTTGKFYHKDKTVEVEGFEDTTIYLKKSINPELKEFFQEYIDVETLNFVVGELKKFEVTLYDCSSFITSREDNNDNYINGVNSILFNSKETYGYCYLIHKFRIDEKVGESVINELEFISIDGEKHSYKRELKQINEESDSDIYELDKASLDYEKMFLTRVRRIFRV